MRLQRFPRRTLRGDTELYRIHRRGRYPWSFSADGAGRFDPVGTGLGACYLAERPLGAWIEVFRRETQLSEIAVSERTMVTVRLGRDLRLADITSRRALQFGVTASLEANEEYTDSLRFAVEALEHGFAGIRYWLRHDPAQRLYGVALFGGPQQPRPGDDRWPDGTDVGIPDTLLADARVFGYRILPPP